MNNGQLQINELTTILNEHFQWNKARQNNIEKGHMSLSYGPLLLRINHHEDLNYTQFQNQCSDTL